MIAVTFRRLAESDLRLFHEWLQRPHVKRWWSDRETYEGVVEHYLPSIDGRDPTELYFAVVDERPVGFIQTYLLTDYPEYAALVGEGEGVAGVDLFVADEAMTGRGLGTEMLRRFVGDVVFARTGVVRCVADPDVRNIASLRAFEKAGFERAREFVDPEDGRLHALVVRDRG
ncbi:MAG TPA: GNAT family N-acetyltransferase [Gaiellaceae bacterium]